MTPSSSSDRSFGIVFAVVFAVISYWPLLGGTSVHIWALIVSTSFLLIAVIRPSLLAPLNRLWTKFGFLLNKITSPVILGVVFFSGDYSFCTCNSLVQQGCSAVGQEPRGQIILDRP